ncbi:MAG: dTDP-4-dehydrorhamnose 3,5-epimerase family protein [Elusimicrobia bacterium]|nr:dTDP-4-dehydrorhamnose 3,5-epimerase family protein [Elusimicrobiota bacterium]
MIHDVRITPLKQILDERGRIMHMLRSDGAGFFGFGEIYFSCVLPNVVKGWHVHERMVLNYAVPYGKIRLVLYDDRPESPSRGGIQEIEMGPDHYVRVTIPPLVWNGFIGLGRETSIVANCASIPHDPLEIRRLDPFDNAIPYRWPKVGE